MEISKPSVQYCYEPLTALKIKNIKTLKKRAMRKEIDFLNGAAMNCCLFVK